MKAGIPAGCTLGHSTAMQNLGLYDIKAVTVGLEPTPGAYSVTDQ